MGLFQFLCPPMQHYLTGGEDTYAPGRSHLGRSGIGVFDLLVVTRGCLFMGEAEEKWDVEAGSFLILRPDRYHYGYKPCAEETHFYWVHFQTQGRWCELSDDGRTEPPIVPGKSEFLARIPRFGRLSSPSNAYLGLDTLRGIVRQSAYQWKEQILFQQLLLSLQSEHKEGPVTTIRIAEQAAAYLREHYREPLQYEALGAALNFHPTYIARCMKQAFGCTPLEYAARCRIEQAKLLLMNTDWPVGRIAEETGFGTFSFFTRCFTRNAGMSPREYRKKYWV